MNNNEKRENERKDKAKYVMRCPADALATGIVVQVMYTAIRCNLNEPKHQSCLKDSIQTTKNSKQQNTLSKYNINFKLQP